MSDKQPMILIRKKKKVAGGHHGGAWKVAYADFVTAMMAFFLLLWLLNVTTDVQRKGIADYFAPTSISSSQGGAGGLFGGRTMSAPEAKYSDTSAPGVADADPQPPGYSEEEAEMGAGPKDKSADKDKLDALEKQREQEEQQKFKAVEKELRQVIEANTELSGLSKSLIIDQTQEGLRIQIVDQNNYSMFPSGSAQMYPQTRKLIELVGKAVSQLPNRLAISGHTDSKPFASNATRDNWDLSAERANASRRVLIAGGIAENRVQNVVGRADREPLDQAQVDDPKNRRISIVLLRQSLFEKKDAAPDAPISVSDPNARPKSAFPAYNPANVPADKQ